MIAASVAVFLATLALLSAAPTDDAGVLEFKNGTSLEASEADIKVFFYSRRFAGGVQIQHSNYRSAIQQTDFNPSKRTIFVIHGWQDSNQAPFCAQVRQAYLRVADCNVFVIDWHNISRMGYLYARGAVPQVANILSRLINSLQSYHKLSLNNVNLVGHSLGAHVAGLTGAELHGQVDTIIGLDPAGPNFSANKPNERLDRSDARYVHAVHTCPGLLGTNYNVGHSDYWANNGRSQPGCGVDATGNCAHGRSFAYFAESLISGKFGAHQCGNYAQYHSGACNRNRQSNMGGFNVDKGASGSYFFETNASPPYAKW